MNFNIDIAIVGAFLLLTLFVGLGHGQKVRSIKDYALGGRNFSTGALVATITATWIGGDYLFITLAEVYKTGFQYAIGCLGMAVCLFINAFVFAPRMSKFLGKLSVAEMMGDLYGKEIRIITALSASIATAGFIAVQFKIFDSILGIFFGLQSDYYIFVIAAVVVFYSAFGGIKSVAFTDALQFFTFGVLFPILGAVLWYNCINIPGFSIVKALNNPIFDFSNHFIPSGSAFWPTVSLFIMFALPDINPPIFQRFSIGKDVQQVKTAFFYSAIIVALILISMSWISFLLFNLSTELDPNLLVPYIVDNYASHGLKLFILLGIISMCMSSADSNINSASVILTHDFCNVVNIKCVSELFLSKVISVLLGVLSLYFAMLDYDLLPLVFMTQSFYIPIIDVPLIMAILGFKSSTRAVIIGMTASLISVVLWRIFFMDTGIDSILPGTFVNLVFFISAHYLLREPGGWNRSLDKKELKPKFYLPFNVLSKKNFMLWLEKTLPKNSKSFVVFGVYSMISTICSMYSISNSSLAHSDKNSLILLYEVNLMIAVCFLAYPLWSARLKKNKPIMMLTWNMCMMFVLVLTPSFLSLVNNESQSQFIIFVLNLIVLSVLTRWKQALIIIIINVIISVCLHIKLGTFENVLSISSHWMFFYGVLLSSAAIIIFLKPKQEEQEIVEAKVDTLEGELEGLDDIILNLKKQEGEYTKQIADLNQAVTHYSERVADQAKEIERLGATAQKILNNVNHELRLPVGNVMNFSQMICEGLDKYTPDQLKDLSDEVYKNSTRLSSMILNMLDLAMLDVRKINLNKSTENFSELVRDRVKICRNMYLQGKPIKFKLTIEPEILIPIDPNYIRQVVDNLTINAINFSEKGLIEVEVRRQGDKAVMMMRDEGIGIPKHELFDIFDPFRMGSNTATKAEGRGVGLALCKSAVEAHDGIITAESPEGKGAVFYVVLPREGSIS